MSRTNPLPHRLTATNGIGLALACTLDSPAVLIHRAEDGSTLTPLPDWFAVINAALGFVTFITVLWTWRMESRTGARFVAASRILSLLITVSAFAASGTPSYLAELMAEQTVATALVVCFVLARRRRE
ncbi:hypothetical protein [Kitasatospora sp. NPDC085879]|uniref:hypothetical protein n=1 Tax=Kitasatospora sp. NPDC085879 TaxID=3154769 RepID=UPI003428DEE4